MALGVQTLSSGTKQIPYMTMTDAAMACAAPIRATDFDKCRVPGGVDLWERQGFYSPGVCFAGYDPLCSQTRPPSEEWPLRVGETAVRCVPEGYKCNRADKDQRFATLESGGTIITVPAFEVRWRSEDLKGMGQSQPVPTTTGPNKGGMPTATMTLSNMTKNGSGTGSGASATTVQTESSTGTGDNTGSAGIESGVVAGIAVACALAAFALAMAIVFLLRYRRRQRPQGAEAGSNNDDREPGLAPASASVAEMDGGAMVVEVDGTPAGHQQWLIPSPPPGHRNQEQRNDQDHSGPAELESRSTELPASTLDGGGQPTSPVGSGSGSVSASVTPGPGWRHPPVEVAAAGALFELPG